jgi:hypothetical protein
MSKNNDDSMLVDISKERKTLISWLEQPKNYVELYQDIVSKATPTLFESLLEKISLNSVANQRRISRIKSCLANIEQKREEASQILQGILTFASKQLEDAANENRWCIGDIVRLEEEIKTQKSKVKIVIETCKDTIEFIKGYNNTCVPINYLDWAEINFDMALTDSGLTTEKRVRHQERWRLVIDEIEQERLIATRLRSSEIRRQLSAVSELMYNQVLNSAKREKVLLNERFGLLKLIIETGDVSRIDNFFGEKIHGSSLDEFASEIKKIEFKIDNIKLK